MSEPTAVDEQGALFGDPIEVTERDCTPEKKRKEAYEMLVDRLTDELGKPVVDVAWLDMPRWKDVQEN